MKKIVFALAVLMFATPALAEVQIICEQVPNEPNIVIKYVCTEGEDVRCFGLNIQLNNAETISAVECLSTDYYVYPGQFSYDGVTPSFGSCVCGSGYPDTLPGLDSNGVTIEMCSLYAAEDPEHQNPPAASGDLVKLTVTGECLLEITENGIRGGVIDEDNVDIDPNVIDPVSDCNVTGLDCFTDPDPVKVQNWIDVGKPQSWCCDYQAMGDCNGDGCINILDLLQAFKPSYGSCYPAAAYQAEADNNHDKCVNILDLLQNFKPNYGTCPGSPYDCPGDGYGTL
jgi:hypothetical protein